MPPTTIRTAPAVADFTPLAEHQSRTPDTFFGGKPVLHAHFVDATAWLPGADRAGLSTIFPGDSAKAPGQDGMLEQKVDVFVASESVISIPRIRPPTCTYLSLTTTTHSSNSYLTLFNHSTDSGIQLPYPSIALHAVKNVALTEGSGPTPAIYMQLIISSPADDEFETAELTLAPPPPASDSTSAAVTTTEFFSAISDCSNLNPDAPAAGDGGDGDDRIMFESGEEAVEGYSGVFSGASGGGIPPPMPGSGGWITSENVHEFFDADGNFIGNQGQDGEDAEELGEGAGRVRVRAEVEAAEEHADGTPNGDTDTKRPRVE
ncbi:hypothetical protein MKZ38_000631 [Zalerion maritima]|uniref:Uncharacterized protein n=1 Tax=Zalerion maritima TaxID=339359 RepID=A0AAD5RSU6_9PEZI|nr:hypothetical protein MKZ38_000631 [Zalerion maritima]